jgi:hypothetical protein
MSETIFRRGLLAPALLFSAVASATAQQATATQGFGTADAAMDALVAALKRKDNKALASILGPWWLDFIPTSDRNFERSKATFLAAWDLNHKVKVEGDKAIVEVGSTGSRKSVRSGASTPGPARAKWSTERSVETSSAPSRPCSRSAMRNAIMPSSTR